MSSSTVQVEEAASVHVDVGSRFGRTSRAVLKVLECGEPRSTVQVALACRLPVKTVYHAVNRLWYMGRLLRSSKPTGRVELPDCRYSNRPDYRYLLRNGDESERIVRSVRYVADSRLTKTLPGKAVGNVRRNSTTGRIVTVLCDHGPLTFRQIVKELNLPERSATSALYGLYRTKRIIHTEKRPLQYAVNTDANQQFGRRFVIYKKRDGKSKRQRILEWISKNLQKKVIFTVDLKHALVCEGVQLSQSQIMDTLRRREWSQSGFSVYIRGYQQGHRQSPFAKGYAITAFDNTKCNDVALAEAVERTERLLKDQPTKSPVLDYAQKAYHVITDLSLRKDISSTYYIRDRLGVKGHRLDRVLKKDYGTLPEHQTAEYLRK